MEHIGDILHRKRGQINTSNKNTGTWSGVNAEEAPPRPRCSICGDFGFVYADVPVGHPNFGKAIACRCAREEFEQERQSRLQRYSNLGSLTRFTFASLLPQGRNAEPQNQEKFRLALEAAKAFATEPQGWLVLIGPAGSGKTHLAAAIANERINNGYPVFFQSVPDLMDHLRSTFSPDSEILYDELFERVRNVPLLVLDDLGAQTSTPWTMEKLDQLLNHRFNNELPTVITTSTPVTELEESLRSRLTDPQLSQIYLIAEKPAPLAEHKWDKGFELQKSMTFDSFDWKRVNLPIEQRENLKESFRLAHDFAKSPEDWLIIQGDTGCGKTHLAAAIANYRYQAGQPALFVVVPDFLDHLRSTFSPESKVTYDQLFERVKTTPLLILDDFGEHTTTPWAKEKLYQVINYRYNARLATVITTRCPLDEIDSPIASRLVDHKISNFFNITAPDYRGDATARRKSARRGKR